MIFGEYPCCNGSLVLGMPDTTPAYMPENCPHCGAKVWHVLSRIGSMTYLEEEFLKLYKVDEENHTVELLPA